jgi:hypothetical protein
VEEEGLEPCAICLEDYKQGDEICWSHNLCAHVFHQECIVEWLVRHDGCPICRRDFLSHEDLDSEETGHPVSVEQSPAEEQRTVADEVHSPTEE